MPGRTKLLFLLSLVFIGVPCMVILTTARSWWAASVLCEEGATMLTVNIGPDPGPIGPDEEQHDRFKYYCANGTGRADVTGSVLGVSSLVGLAVSQVAFLGFYVFFRVRDRSRASRQN